MRYYLEPKGWPTALDVAMPGLLARLRKGRALLYFKTNNGTVYDMSGTETKPTGLLSPVVLKTEN